MCTVKSDIYILLHHYAKGSVFLYCEECLNQNANYSLLRIFSFRITHIYLVQRKWKRTLRTAKIFAALLRADHCIHSNVQFHISVPGLTIPVEAGR